MKPRELAPLLAALSLLGAAAARAEVTTTRYKTPVNASTAATEADDKDKKSEKNGRAEGEKASSRKGGQQSGEAPVTGASAECAMKRAPAGLAGLAEASGVAASRRTPGILWSHGDSYVGEPYLYAFDSSGAVKGKVRLEGVTVADWEAIAVGPCGGSKCLYVGDIGDNQSTRKSITIHRLPEPLPADQAAASREAFHATFPDGAQDAESMFVSSSGEMFVVTKGEAGPIAVYRFGPSPKAGGTTVLQRVAVIQAGKVTRNQWVTDASASPDGQWVAMRTHGAVYFYDAERLMRGDVKSPLKFDATSLKEPQGEGIALGADGAMFLAGEGGGKGAAGTLSSGICKLPDRP